MWNSPKLVVALAYIVTAIMTAAAGIVYNSPADTAALPFAGSPGRQTPVGATKGDRLDVRPEIRTIAGVTLVLRDFGPIVR